MICEMEQAVEDIGLQPQAEDDCRRIAEFRFPYGPWVLCGKCADSALFAGLWRQEIE